MGSRKRTRCTRTRGKKGTPHPDPSDPPRQRANKVRGHGTWENDRPPILGVVGRDSGQARMDVLHNSTTKEILPRLLESTHPGSRLNTDEWGSYHSLPQHDRTHKTVCHKAGEWARDDDGDGVREVHNNTVEGIWTGLRNFLRLFRGVNKTYLSQYVAVFAWAHHLKAAGAEFIALLLGRQPQLRAAPA